MQTISVNQFVQGVNSIFTEKPLFEDGCDGSNGKCDKMGLIRGGLIRGGAVNVKGLKDLKHINFEYVQRIDLLTPTTGSIVLRGDKDGYTDIGVVVKDFPISIVFMSNVTVRMCIGTDGWDYVGWLPYVEEEHGETARVCSGKGTVRMFYEPKFSSVMTDIPDNSEITFFGIDGTFARISYNGATGYVMAKFIKQAERKISEIDLEELERAYVALGKFLGHIKETQNETNERSRVHRWRKRNIP